MIRFLPSTNEQNVEEASGQYSKRKTDGRWWCHEEFRNSLFLFKKTIALHHICEKYYICEKGKCDALIQTSAPQTLHQDMKAFKSFLNKLFASCRYKLKCLSPRLYISKNHKIPNNTNLKWNCHFFMSATVLNVSQSLSLWSELKWAWLQGLVQRGSCRLDRLCNQAVAPVSRQTLSAKQHTAYQSIFITTYNWLIYSTNMLLALPSLSTTTTLKLLKV